MEGFTIEKLIKFLTSGAFYGSVIIIIIAIVLLHFIKQYLIKKVAYSGKDEQHKNTFIGVIFSILQYLVVVLAVVMVLNLNGVNVGSILAGLGIMSAIIGLALQDTLKDIISGINIYNNNFYKVGDMVRWNGEPCDVSYFSARVTKFRSVYTNSTYTVNNSLINNIEKIKDMNFIMYSFSFNYDSELIKEAFDKILERLKAENPNVKQTINVGPINITSKGVDYGLLYSCPAHKQLFVAPDLARIAVEEFKNYNIKPLFDALLS